MLGKWQPVGANCGLEAGGEMLQSIKRESRVCVKTRAWQSFSVAPRFRGGDILGFRVSSTLTQSFPRSLSSRKRGAGIREFSDRLQRPDGGLEG
jgi:hypothetical protein